MKKNSFISILALVSFVMICAMFVLYQRVIITNNVVRMIVNMSRMMLFVFVIIMTVKNHLLRRILSGIDILAIIVCLTYTVVVTAVHFDGKEASETIVSVKALNMGKPSANSTARFLVDYNGIDAYVNSNPKEINTLLEKHSDVNEISLKLKVKTAFDCIHCIVSYEIMEQTDNSISAASLSS